MRVGSATRSGSIRAHRLGRDRRAIGASDVARTRCRDCDRRRRYRGEKSGSYGHPSKPDHSEGNTGYRGNARRRDIRRNQHHQDTSRRIANGGQDPTGQASHGDGQDGDDSQNGCDGDTGEEGHNDHQTGQAVA